MALVEILKDRDPDEVFDEIMENEEEMNKVAEVALKRMSETMDSSMLKTAKLLYGSMRNVIVEGIVDMVRTTYEEDPVLGKYVKHERFPEFVDKLLELVIDRI